MQLIETDFIEYLIIMFDLVMNILISLGFIIYLNYYIFIFILPLLLLYMKPIYNTLKLNVVCNNITN